MMLETDIDLMRCPGCAAPLRLEAATLDVCGEVEEGVAVCVGCSARYPVVEYVLVLLPDSAARTLLTPARYATYARLKGYSTPQSADCTSEALASGLNWSVQIGDAFRVTREALEGEGFWGRDSFWTFCGLTPQDVAGKNVCVYCGGSGREAFHLLRGGAGKVIIIDIGSHLFNVRGLCGDGTRLVPVLTDFYVNPVDPACVDISICDHALQHIADNRRAYASIALHTRPGGVVSVCVYSHENNFLMTRLVEPSKKVLHKLGNKALMRIALLPAAMLFAAHLAYECVSALSGRTADRLPFRDLLRLWARDGFSKFHEACFDLLHAPISYHFKRDELLDMARVATLSVSRIEMVNGTMWTMIALKPQE